MNEDAFTPREVLPAGTLTNLIAETVALRTLDDQGDRQRGACPWHLDRTASLHVNSTTWHCFACRDGGDAVDWIMRRNTVDRDHAREMLQVYLEPKP